MSFLGTYADFDGQQIGAFRIDGLTGRDASGAPVWRIVCDGCHYPQTLPHSKIAPLVQGRNSQVSLLCANSACKHSHREWQSETLSDFRRREAVQDARAAGEAQRTADAEAAKQRAESSRQAEIQRQYVQYVNSQWAAGQSDEKICIWQHWLELTPSTRQLVSDLIAKNRIVRIGNL